MTSLSRCSWVDGWGVAVMLYLGVDEITGGKSVFSMTPRGLSFGFLVLDVKY